MMSAACAASSARVICAAIEQRALHGQRAVAQDQLLQVRPVQVLHDEVERTVRRRPRIGDVDDVGVADLRRRPRLAPEAFDHVGRGVKAGVQHLDRDAPADVDVVRFVDAPHRSLAAQPAHVVAAADGGADARVFSQPPAERPTAERCIATLAVVRPAGGCRPRRRRRASRPSRSRPTAAPWRRRSAASRSRRSRAASSANIGRRNSATRAASVFGAVAARNPARSARIASPSW